MISAHNTTIRLSLLDLPADKAKRLALRIEEGDAVAETELVESYSTGLRLILLKRTGSPQLAENLCQDTLIIALQKLRAGQAEDAAIDCGTHRAESRIVRGPV